MPYYKGDYYRGDNYGCGDYYRGDFLGIGKFFKKTVLPIAKGFVTGGPLGAVSGFIKSRLPAQLQPMVRDPIPTAAANLAAGFPGLPPTPFPLAPGLADVPQQPVGTMLPSGFIPGCQLKGTRPNKSSYFKRVPGTLQGVLIPKGSVCVKSRRLNVANPRALRRAIRRAQGFAKLARRVMTFVSAKAPRGRPRFKKR